MTNKLVSSRYHLSAPSSTKALALAGLALSWLALSTSAQERTISSPSMVLLAPASRPADLERAFWICDHAATTQGVDGGMAIACSAITEDLKMKKFNGDFDSMVAWWRQNKAAEHQALATSGHATSGR